MTNPEIVLTSPRQARLQEIAAQLATIATEFVQVRDVLDDEGNEALANHYDDLIADITAAEIAAKNIVGFEANQNLTYTEQSE